jgi:ribonuclease VapC
MVLDTSAICAVLFGEDTANAVLDAIGMDPRLLLSAASYVETSIVLESRRGVAGTQDFDRFVRRAGVNVVAVDRHQADLARAAWRLFGKGRHSAGLNLGDCFSYALAQATGEPLLCVGADFGQTDIALVKV